MAPSALLKALQKKKALIAAINDSGAYHWNIPEKDQTHEGIAKSCHADLSPTCQALTAWLQKDRRDKIVQFSIGPTNIIKEKQRIDTEERKLLPVPYPTIKAPRIEFFGQGVYDILGWILSCFGPVTASANIDYFQASHLDTLKHDFLEPLLDLYAQWCNTIWLNKSDASTRTYNPQIDTLPAMTEIVVRAVSRSTIYFALGASISGFPNDDAALVRKRRKDMMISAKLLNLTKEDFQANKLMGFPYPKILAVAPDELLKLIGGPKIEIEANNKKYTIWNKDMTRPGLKEALKQQQAKLASDQPIKILTDVKELKASQERIKKDQEAIALSEGFLAEIERWKKAHKDLKEADIELPKLRNKMSDQDRQKLLTQQEAKLEADRPKGVLKDTKALEEWQKLLKQHQDEITKTKDELARIAKWEYVSKQPHFPFRDWKEFYYFTHKWLNKEALESGAKFGGAAFGDCAETYPLLMLAGDAYKAPEAGYIEKDMKQVNAWGSMAVMPRDAANANTLDAAQLRHIAQNPCLNCRRVIESRAVGGDKVSFYNGKEIPFGLNWADVQGKVAP